jgi:sister chromatid cohesion protein DCC1
LSAHAPTRFTDLFLARARWRPDEMIPFMRGLYPEGDTKARDKLVAKYIRVVKEREGAWWYPRRTG